MKRRTLLKVGLGGGVLLALGGVGLSLRGPTRSRDVPAGLKTLSDRQYLTLAAFSARVTPNAAVDQALVDNKAKFPSSDDVGVAQKLDTLFSTMHPGDVGDLKQLLDLLDNALGGLLLEGRTQTFTGSSAAEQDKILASWRTSGVTLKRTGYKALVGLCAATYFTDPRTYPACGYPGPPNYGNATGGA
ncbi:MAG: hypothetical protein KC502_17755 [Myxococcales bacterium]|nr:hypothetical protein [Myxococcales bacterium]